LVILLCGAHQNSGSRIVLPAGEQRHPFAIAVPQNIPSSFEGRIGHIRYELKGITKDNTKKIKYT